MFSLYFVESYYYLNLTHWCNCFNEGHKTLGGCMMNKRNDEIIR